MAERPEHAERDGHRGAAADDRQGGGDQGPEDQKQDEHGDRQGVGLGLAQVLGRDRRDVVVDGGLAGHEGLELR